MYAIAFDADIDPVDFRRAFPTKLDLIYEITVHCTRSLVSRETSAAAAERSPLEQMRGLIRRHIEFSWEHRTELELRRALMPTLRAIYPARHRELSGVLRAYRDRVQGIIERGRELGQFARPGPSEEPASAATVLQTLESILNWYDPDADLTLAQLSDVYVDLIIHHLLDAPRD
ncbi:TetR/AcrR family transcriptional regulator [Actinorugispora endophytica]